MTTIDSNLQTVHARIQAACLAAKRDPHVVRLMAVSKTFDAAQVSLASQAGQRVFGENYVQEAVEKISQLRDEAQAHDPLLEWHCIGPVQSNKTRLVAQYFDWVHTVDRLKIAQRLSEQRPPELAPLQVCIQVNVDAGGNKSGVAPEDALILAQQISALSGLCLRGLMVIPEPAPDFEANYSLFMRAKTLFDVLNQAGMGLDTLSMGMSADLEAAIHAGSTMVRVGTAIFGGRAAHATAST